MSHTKPETKRPNSTSGMSRRVFLHRGTALIGGAALATTFLGCGGSEPEGFVCTTGLTPQQTQMRQTMSYTDMGADATKLCKDCNFFPAGAPLTPVASARCSSARCTRSGSCTSFAGAPELSPTPAARHPSFARPRSPPSAGVAFQAPSVGAPGCAKVKRVLFWGLRAARLNARADAFPQAPVSTHDHLRRDQRRHR
jgi:hypothetical protein